MVQWVSKLFVPLHSLAVPLGVGMSATADAGVQERELPDDVFSVNASRHRGFSEAYFYGTILDCRAIHLPVRIDTEFGTAAQPVHVIYATDRKRLHGALASMLSVAKHLELPERCVIHILADGQLYGAVQALIACFQKELLRLSFKVPDVRFHMLRALPFNASALWYSKASALPLEQALARWYVHQYLPDVPRAIWLDTDTVVKADLGILFRAEMLNAVAAVPRQKTLDAFARELLPRHRRHLRWHDLKAQTFNSGVLLLDLGRWRSGHLERDLERWFKLVSGYDVDQLPLNLAFQGRYDVLSWEWHVIGAGNENAQLPSLCMQDARIVHFNGDCKPWRSRNRGPRGWQCFNRELYLPHLPKQACLFDN